MGRERIITAAFIVQRIAPLVKGGANFPFVPCQLWLYAGRRLSVAAAAGRGVLRLASDSISDAATIW